MSAAQFFMTVASDDHALSLHKEAAEIWCEQPYFYFYISHSTSSV